MACLLGHHFGQTRMHASACMFRVWYDQQDKLRVLYLIAHMAKIVPIPKRSLFCFLFQQIFSSLGPGNNNNRTPYFLEISAPPLLETLNGGCFLCCWHLRNGSWESNFLLLHLPELFVVCESQQYSIKVPQNLAIVLGINTEKF